MNNMKEEISNIIVLAIKIVTIYLVTTILFFTSVKLLLWFKSDILSLVTTSITPGSVSNQSKPSVDTPTHVSNIDSVIQLLDSKVTK
jgi:hypothetical protein